MYEHQNRHPNKYENIGEPKENEMCLFEFGGITNFYASFYGNVWYDGEYLLSTQWTGYELQNISAFWMKFVYYDDEMKMMYNDVKI